MQHNSVNTETPRDYHAYAAMFCACLLWGSAYITTKYILRVFEPVTVIFLRMSVASLCCIVLVPLFRIRVNYQAGDWKWFLLMVLCEPGLYFLFESHALTYTSASQAGMLVATIPIFVGIGAGIFLKENLPRQAWIGCLVAAAGVIWLNAGAVADEHAPRPILGNSLELIAMVFGSAFAICARRLSRNYSPLFLTAVQAWGGFLFFLPLVLSPIGGFPSDAPISSWLCTVYLGLAISVGAYGLYNYSFKRLPAGQVSIYLNLIPVFTLGLGMLVLGERLTMPQYLACALVLGGVIISQRR